MSGITDENNIQIEGHDAIRMIANSTDLVTIGASDWEIEAGALCGVIKSGREQGMLVAHQLLAHWEGKEIKDLSLVQNMDGKRYINLSTMKKPTIAS